MTGTIVAVAVVPLLAVACAQQPQAAPEAPPSAPAEPAAAEHAHPAPAAAPSAELPAVPDGAKVFFVEPADGAKISGPLENGKVGLTVKMGAEGIAIKPAGAVEAGSGHHHVLVDLPDGMTKGMVIPMDEQHLHFGKAQTEARLALAPGAHTLTLQLADGIHRSYGAPLTATIKLEVAAAGSVGAAAPTSAPAQ